MNVICIILLVITSIIFGCCKKNVCSYRSNYNYNYNYNYRRSEPVNTETIQVSSVINIHTEKELINPPFLQLAPLKSCISSENIVFEKPNFKNEKLTMIDEMYFDMESW